MPYNKEFATFIDSLRKSRNIPKEEFVKDIISLRQYYRFLKGESSISSDVVSHLFHKLEMGQIGFQAYLIQSSNKNKLLLTEVYSYVRKREFCKAKIEFDLIDEASIFSPESKKYYSFLNTIINMNLKLTTYDNGINQLIDLIAYPEVLKKNVFTFIEETALIYINDYLLQKNDFTIASRIYEVLSISNNSQKMYSIALWSTIAQSLGYNKSFKESLDLCDNSIHLFSENSELSALARIYYLKSLNEKRIYEDKRYYKSLIKLFSLLKHLDQKQLYEMYSNYVFDNFGIYEEDLITYEV